MIIIGSDAITNCINSTLMPKNGLIRLWRQRMDSFDCSAEGWIDSTVVPKDGGLISDRLIYCHTRFALSAGRSGNPH